MRFVVFAAACLIFSASALFAQEAENQPLVPRQRMKQIKDWVEKYQKYQDWDRKWHNRIYSFKRKVAPQPPAWLEQDCRDLDLLDVVLAVDAADRDRFIFLDETAAKQDTFQVACLLLKQWKDDYQTARIRQEISALRIKADKPKHTLLFEHIHVGGFWEPTSTGYKVQGMFESHITFPIGGRVQLFAAPGMMLVCRHGTHDCGLAYDWGMSVRLFNFRFPFLNRPASLHANLVKAWLLNGSKVPGVKTNLDIGGLSVTFRRKP